MAQALQNVVVNSTGAYGAALVAGCAWATWVTQCGNLTAYGNGSSFNDTGCGAPNGCRFGLEFQCNELAQRYAYYAWGEPATWYGYGGSHGSAYQMWAAGPALPMPLQQFRNGGGTLPRVGDLLIFNQGWLGGYWDGAGHVAIISNVDTTNGYVTVVEQNATPSGTDRFSLSGSTIRAYGYTPIIGWLRPTMVSQLEATQNTTAFQVTWSRAPSLPPARYFVLWVQPGGGHWQPYTTTTRTDATVYGFPGSTYRFYIEAVGAGYDTGPPTMAQASTTVSTSATWSETAFHTLYAVTGAGALQPGSSPPANSANWGAWDIARGVTLDASGDGGVTLDGWGGLHPFGDVTTARGTGYWNGWDITRAVAAVNNQGYVLDDWGGLHPFSMNGAALPPDVHGTAYWYGLKIARGLALFSDGSGGVVLDGGGGVHPFTPQGAPAPAALAAGPHWPGMDVARGVVLLPGSTAQRYGGYVLDDWGGVHAFGTAGDAPAPISGPGYWPGWDIARGIVLLPGSSSAGYVVEGWGGMHPFGGAPPVLVPDYTPGRDLTRAITIG